VLPYGFHVLRRGNTIARYADGEPKAVMKDECEWLVCWP